MRVQALIVPFVWWGMAQAAFAQDHARLLAPEWKQAAERVEARREAWGEVFASLHADAAECEAVIFPEQLRYSRLQDGMEQAALHALYVDGGKERANFSIGLFQMKPSFAEEVEAAWMAAPMRHVYKLYFDCKDNKEARRRRLLRLKDERWQCVYLAVFMRLMLEREPELVSPSARGTGSLARYGLQLQLPVVAGDPAAKTASPHVSSRFPARQAHRLLQLRRHCGGMVPNGGQTKKRITHKKKRL